MKTNNEQLTLQQQRFCDEYLVNFNAFKAALNAGYSENTARKCELLHLPKVQAYLQDAMKRTSERLEITHDMILRELAKVAFANMGDYYDENAVLKPMNQLTADQKAAISHYQLIDCVGEYGERAGELSKIKLHNKMAALDKIAKHTGFYLVGKKKSESREVEVEERGSSSGELQDSREPEVLSGESQEGELSVVNGEMDDLMEDVGGKMEDVVSGNILTLSVIGIESRGENRATASSFLPKTATIRNNQEPGEVQAVMENVVNKVEPKKGKWSAVNAGSMVCATVCCR